MLRNEALKGSPNEIINQPLVNVKEPGLYFLTVKTLIEIVNAIIMHISHSHTNMVVFYSYTLIGPKNKSQYFLQTGKWVRQHQSDAI